MFLQNYIRLFPHLTSPCNKNKETVCRFIMSYKPPIGDPELLRRRIISNPKFDNVQPVVECGINANLAKLIQSAEPSVKQGKDELFRRVRASTIANALEELHLEIRMKEYEMLEQQQLQQQQQYYRQQGGVPPQQQQQTPDEYQIPKPPKKEYLILDVREREDYEKCHILSAVHYPPTKLSHATNPYTPEILAFKNKENKVIVLYDLDEEVVVARKVGNVFFEKGCDNVVIISGGLKEFVQNFSHLILGESPVPILPKNQRVLSRGGTSVSGGNSIAEGSKIHSTATSHKPKSLSSSLAKPQSGSGSWK